LFHNATFFGFCIIHILHTGCANIKKNSGGKRLNHGNPAVERYLVGRKRSIDIFSVFPPLDVKLSFRVVQLVRNTWRTGTRQQAEKYNFYAVSKGDCVLRLTVQVGHDFSGYGAPLPPGRSGREAVRIPKGH
jgi:hypothetical protein